jgi:hypothetical protein
MQRLTANLLLLFALLGTFVPLTEAVTAQSAHACCLRTAHHCHDSIATNSTDPVISAPSCCSSNCHRAVTTIRWAHAKNSQNTFCGLHAADRIRAQDPSLPAFEAIQFQSSRAPPLA